MRFSQFSSQKWITVEMLGETCFSYVREITRQLHSQEAKAGSTVEDRLQYPSQNKFQWQAYAGLKGLSINTARNHRRSKITGCYSFGP